MQQMAISKFKAQCLAVLEQVRRGRKAILITRFGRPVAEVVPPTVPRRAKDWMGSLRGTITLTGDLVAPAADEHDWEVLRS